MKFSRYSFPILLFVIFLIHTVIVDFSHANYAVMHIANAMGTSEFVMVEEPNFLFLVPV